MIWFDYECGEKNRNAKLKEAEVVQIKQSQESDAVLATRFKTSEGNIWKIRHGLRWAHVRV